MSKLTSEPESKPIEGVYVVSFEVTVSGLIEVEAGSYVEARRKAESALRSVTEAFEDGVGLVYSPSGIDVWSVDVDLSEIDCRGARLADMN